MTRAGGARSPSTCNRPRREPGEGGPRTPLLLLVRLYPIARVGRNNNRNSNNDKTKKNINGVHPGRFYFYYFFALNPAGLKFDLAAAAAVEFLGSRVPRPDGRPKWITLKTDGQRSTGRTAEGRGWRESGRRSGEKCGFVSRDRNKKRTADRTPLHRRQRRGT